VQEPQISLTAVFLKQEHEYVGFVEELPGVNCAGRTLDEARQMLRQLVMVVFDEQRREAGELIGDKEYVREEFLVDLPLKQSLYPRLVAAISSDAISSGAMPAASSEA
jgi:predicted RNase H-like HicB family nuclease